VSFPSVRRRQQRGRCAEEQEESRPGPAAQAVETAQRHEPGGQDDRAVEVRPERQQRECEQDAVRRRTSVGDDQPEHGCEKRQGERLPTEHGRLGRSEQAQGASDRNGA
jgi:hypothetical protein